MKLLEELTLQDFEKMYLLEKKYYDEVYITPADEAYRWYQKNTKSVVVVVVGKEEEIVGFCNVFPVKERVYKAICKGELNDAQLTSEDMLEETELYVAPVCLFFSCIVVQDIPDKSQVIEALLDAYKAYYQGMAKSGVALEEVVLDAVTPGGEHFADRIGLSFHKASTHDSKVYKGTFESFCKAIEENKKGANKS